MEIPLTQGRTAIIDPEDWPLVAPYSWHAKRENGKLWYAAAGDCVPVSTSRTTFALNSGVNRRRFLIPVRLLGVFNPHYALV